MSPYEDFIEGVIANSYKDFHAKGIDYICTMRTPDLTVKYYILDGASAVLPEVVNPHNHRYNFHTTVLAGELTNHIFTDSEEGEVYQQYDYDTPLNGGNGFTDTGEVRRMASKPSMRMGRGDSLFSFANDVHTIQAHGDRTVIRLTQGPDVIPVGGAPTQCWVRNGYPEPNTSGLYGKFTEDEALERIELLTQLTKGMQE